MEDYEDTTDERTWGIDLTEDPLSYENKKFIELINSMSRRTYDLAKEKGCSPKNVSAASSLMGITSELAEAYTALRHKNFSRNIQDFDKECIKNCFNSEEYVKKFNEDIKDTFEDELADVILRLLNFAGSNDIDIGSHIIAKHIYNSCRDWTPDPTENKDFKIGL